jgi:hypothetical protein
MGNHVDASRSGYGVIDEERALKMYELAMALVKTNGALVPISLGMVREYRAGSVTIHYLPKSGHMDVWSGRKVLSIERLRGDVRVTRYTPGDWEEELEALAANPRSKG